MRINQMEGEREWSNLLLHFFFFSIVGCWVFLFLPLEPLALGKAGKKKGTGKKKGDKEQNNSIRMLLDLFFFSS